MTRVPRLHAITDDARLADPRFVDDAAAVMAEGGADVALHLRGKTTTGAQLYRLATSLVTVARASGARLLINDRIDIALASDAHGVQLREDSIGVARTRALLGADALIGVSRHEQSTGGDDRGADFVVFGAIYSTGSHPDRAPAGLAALAVACGARRPVPESAALPVIAIGGITPERVADVLRAGAYGVAALSTIWSGGTESVRAYLEELSRAADADGSHRTPAVEGSHGRAGSAPAATGKQEP